MVYTLDGDTATNSAVGATMSAAQWAGHYWQTVRVRGAGVDTKILAGSGGPRGVWLLTTGNGNTFTPGAWKAGAFGSARQQYQQLRAEQRPGYAGQSLVLWGVLPQQQQRGGHQVLPGERRAAF